MAKILGYEQLDAWQSARRLANEAYALSSEGRFAKDFVLRDQVRRAAISVVSNIAEGFGRGGNAEFIQFLSIAKGSAAELMAQMRIAADQAYIQESRFERLQELAAEASGKIGGLIAYLKSSRMTGHKYQPPRQDPNPGPRTPNPERGTRQRGFNIVTAIFLIVVLAMLGVFIVSVSGLQQTGARFDLQGVRGYQAARAGIEWAAFKVLDPNNALNPATCTTLAACPAASATLPALGGSLSPFAVTVTCAALGTPATEGNRQIQVYAITSTATAGTAGTTGYINRQLQATLSKCLDTTATPPRCSCG